MTRRFVLLFVLLAACANSVLAAPFWRRGPNLGSNFAAANKKSLTTPVKRWGKGPHVLRAQILLDRARFSPGEIDGLFGSNLSRAIVAYRSAHGLTPIALVDEKTWALLNRDEADVIVRHALSEVDVAGPFLTIPTDMMQKAALPSLAYSSSLEALGERHHCSPRLLQTMNPGRSFKQKGEEIFVPNVNEAPPEKAARIVVDGSDLSLSVLSDTGKLIAHYPATVGSKHDPLPVGEWKINGVARNPDYHYNPGLFWDAEPGHAKAKIAAGPNNPVGVVWIDLSKEHYGIHGTPEPSTIGKTSSHGCIRLTNWSAMELAAMVGPGVPVTLKN